MLRSHVVLLWAMVLFVFLGCKNKENPPSQRPSPSNASLQNDLKKKGQALAAEKSKETALENKRVFVGTVLSNRKVVVSPQIGGVIQRIYVAKGDYVKKNSRLVLISCRDYRLMEKQVESQIAVAQAGLKLAQTQKQNAQREFKRFRRLFRKRSLSAYQLDKIKMGLQIAKAQEALAARRIQVAKVGLRIAQRRRMNCVTRAPFSGIVTNRMMDEGGMARAMPPSHVLIIEEITPIIIEVPVGEMYLKDLQLANKALVFAPALGSKPLYTLKGKTLAKSLMPSINPYNRAATLRIKLANAEKVLKPGMSIELHVFQQSSAE